MKVFGASKEREKWGYRERKLKELRKEEGTVLSLGVC